MKKANLSWLLILIVSFFAVSFITLSQAHQVKSAAATHLVISEVQVAGAASTDDFVELYNPTSSVVDLSDFRLVKVTTSGVDDDSIVAFVDGDEIPAHGYFLWCNSALAATLSCDSSTGGTVANNNSVGLRSGALNTGTLIDAVSFGTVTNTLGEGTSLTSPAASSSAERKANSTSTIESMTSGSDVGMGNGEDTDNNSSDFILRATSGPQNSSSVVEPALESPSPTPSESPSPTPSASPTPEPTPTPSESPTPTPTATPTPEGSPTPTPEASPTPSTSPTATPSATPTSSPTPTPSPTINLFPFFKISCTKEIKVFDFGFIQFRFPLTTCRLQRN